MAKNSIFSGQKLSDQERKKIEEQLKRSRERDIKAMEESNKRRKKRNARPRLKKIKQYVGGAREGKEAHERYKAIMDNVFKNDRDEVRGMDYEDVFDAADALVEDATGYWSAEELENYIMEYLGEDGKIDTE